MEETVIKKGSSTALWMHILCTVFFVGLGIGMFILKPDLISLLCYNLSIFAIGMLFLGFGLFYIIKFFVKHEYRIISNYGFTKGAIYIIIGCLILFNKTLVSDYVDKIVYYVAIILGTIMFQQAFSLFQIQKTAWFINLILGIGTILIALYFNFCNIKIFDGQIIGALFLIINGILSLFSLLLMALGLKFEKRAFELKDKQEADAGSEEKVIEDPDKDSNTTLIEEQILE